jgi:fatty-acyl-CoA synthase
MGNYLLMQDIVEANRGITERGLTFIDEADEEAYISYKQLYERSSCLLQDLQNSGVEAGHELLIQIQDNRLFLEVFWACVMGKIIAVPVTVGTNEETRLKVCKVWGKLNHPHLIGDEAVAAGLAQFAEDQREWLPHVSAMKDRFIDTASLQAAEAGKMEEARPDDIAFIQFSSGSTGDPKGVMLTHANVMSNVGAMKKVWGIGADERALSWMPLTHDMGLIAMHLLHAYTQSSQYIMRTKLFILNPLLWIQKTHQHRINRLYSPNFGYKYFLAFYDEEHDYGWDLSGLTCLCNGAEPISIEISEQFVEQLSKYKLPHSAMRPAYGLAEGTVGVSFTPIGESLRVEAVDRRYLHVGEAVRTLPRGDSNGQLYADVGSPIASCEVRIADETGRTLPAATIGYIHIRGPSVTQGYYNDPDALQQTADGWLNTSDIGFAKDGRLFVVGRAKDILFVNGQNVFAHDIERVAEEVDGVELWNVAACGAAAGSTTGTEQILVFLLYRSRSLERFAALAGRVKQHIHRKMGIFVDHVLPVKAIPKTTSGKIQRYKLGEQYVSGAFHHTIHELEQIRAMQEAGENTEQMLLRLCQDLLGRQLGVDDHFNESGGNSLILTQLSDELARWHGIRVSVPDLYKYPTITKLTAYIERGGSLSLPVLTMDETYFGPDGGPYRTELEAVLDQEEGRKLRDIAGELGTELGYVLLAAYVLLMKLASGADEVNVQVAMEDQRFLPLSVDLGDVDTLDALLERVTAALNAGQSVYHSGDLDRIAEPDGCAMLPLFVMNADGRPVHMQWNEIYDLVIAFVDEDEQVEVLCDYNGHRLKEASVKELFTQYMMLVADIVNSNNKVTV